MNDKEKWFDFLTTTFATKNLAVAFDANVEAVIICNHDESIQIPTHQLNWLVGNLFRLDCVLNICGLVE